MITAQHLTKHLGSRAVPGGETDRWNLSASGQRHRVEISGSLTRRITWYVDDQLVATKKSFQDDVLLEPGEGSDLEDSTPDGSLLDARSPDGRAHGQEVPGTVRVRFTSSGRPRRVTWFQGQGDVDATAAAMLGTGGIDLDPERGSPAALRAERIRRHPSGMQQWRSRGASRRWGSLCCSDSSGCG